MSTFGKSDPRAALNSRFAAAPKNVDAFGQPSYLKFTATPPQEDNAHGRTWYGRGQYFLVAYSETRPGAVFELSAQPDEYMVVAPDVDTEVEITAGGTTLRAKHSIFIVPPGDSKVTVLSGGRLYRLFSTVNTALAARAANAHIYAQPHPNLTAYEPWPAPPAGFKLLCHTLNVPREQQIHGKIYRSTNLMVYISPERHGPRDKTRVTPHHHEGFEQGTINLEGEVVQHIRWPWMKNMLIWREDEHVHCPRGSLTVFPPPCVHTTEHISAGVNVEMVIYAPPRLDWALQPGWILNPDDYPMPENTGVAMPAAD